MIFSWSTIAVGRCPATRLTACFTNSIENSVVFLLIADSITWFNVSAAVAIVFYLSSLIGNCGSSIIYSGYFRDIPIL